MNNLNVLSTGSGVDGDRSADERGRSDDGVQNFQNNAQVSGELLRLLCFSILCLFFMTKCVTKIRIPKESLLKFIEA